ncbi:MAG: hypothetical protein R8M45_03685 [Ghiorsea sp.]
MTKELDKLIGLTMKSVVALDNAEIQFVSSDGSKFRMHHYQDCCESVEIEDICGELSDLVDTPIISAEESCKYSEESELLDDNYTPSQTWTFYKFATFKGFVDIRWYGTSNGYYSESVSFEEVENFEDEW